MSDHERPEIEQIVRNSQNVTQIGKMISEVHRERACPRPPAPPPHFSGRVAQLDDLKQRLQAGEATAITAVQGAGGLGKTTLAQRLAQVAQAELGFAAVLWADVTRNPDAGLLLSHWARYADPACS